MAAVLVAPVEALEVIDANVMSIISRHFGGFCKPVWLESVS